MHIIDIYSVIIQNKGYAPRLALGRRGVNKVRDRWLQNFLLHEDLLVLLDDLVVLLFVDGREIYQLVIYMKW